MTKHPQIKEACILWAKQFQQQHGFFPASSAVNINRNGAPVSYKTLRYAFGSYFNFRVACFNAGIDTSGASAKTLFLSKCKPHISNQFYTKLSNMNSVGFGILDRLVDHLLPTGQNTVVQS